MTQEQPLSGQVALVATACPCATCLSIAMRLAHDGADVAVLSLVTTPSSAEKLSQAASAVREAYPGRKVLEFVTDPADANGVQQALQACVKEFDRLDILVNVVGASGDPNDTLTGASSLNGLFQACRPVARHMLKQRSGRIVNVSAIVAPAAGEAAGGAAGEDVAGEGISAGRAVSKGGVTAFTFTLARELAPRGITVNAVAPGFIRTEDWTEDADTTVREVVPLGRGGTPDEVAAAVAFLCGSGGAYLTGNVIRVDGGLAIG